MEMYCAVNNLLSLPTPQGPGSSPSVTCVCGMEGRLLMLASTLQHVSLDVWLIRNHAASRCRNIISAGLPYSHVSGTRKHFKAHHTHHLSGSSSCSYFQIIRRAGSRPNARLHVVSVWEMFARLQLEMNHVSGSRKCDSCLVKRKQSEQEREGSYDYGTATVRYAPSITEHAHVHVPS